MLDEPVIHIREYNLIRLNFYKGKFGKINDSKTHKLYKVYSQLYCVHPMVWFSRSYKTSLSDNTISALKNKNKNKKKIASTSFMRRVALKKSSEIYLPTKLFPFHPLSASRYFANLYNIRSPAKFQLQDHGVISLTENKNILGSNEITHTNFEEIIAGMHWQNKRVLKMEVYNWKSIIHTAANTWNHPLFFIFG